MPWMPWYHAGYHIRETRSWLEMQVAAFRVGTAYEFAIVSDMGRYLGGCGLSQIDALNRRAISATGCARARRDAVLRARRCGSSRNGPSCTRTW